MESKLILFSIYENVRRNSISGFVKGPRHQALLREIPSFNVEDILFLKYISDLIWVVIAGLRHDQGHFYCHYMKRDPKNFSEKWPEYSSLSALWGKIICPGFRFHRWQHYSSWKGETTKQTLPLHPHNNSTAYLSPAITQQSFEVGCLLFSNLLQTVIF